MERAGGDGDEAAVGGRHVALAVAVVSPGDDGAVGLQAQTVIPARSDGDKVPGQVTPDDLPAPPDDGPLRSANRRCHRDSHRSQHHQHPYD